MRLQKVLFLLMFDDLLVEWLLEYLKLSLLTFITQLFVSPFVFIV